MKIIKFYLVFIALWIFASAEAGAHPYYVSLCQVNFNSETKTLEIQLKIFADDLIMALEKAGHEQLFLGEERENEHTNEYIFDYLKKTLSFSVNDRSMPYVFVGKEMEDDAVWSYLEIQGVNDLHKLAVTCSLLTEVHETQSNMVQVQKQKEIKNMLLTRRNQNGSVSFGQ